MNHRRIRPALLLLALMHGSATAAGPAETLSPRVQAVLDHAPADAREERNPIAGNQVAIKDGERWYRSWCFSCHGERGMGDGPAAGVVAEVPNLVDKKRRKLLTEGQRFWVVHEGVTGTAMQPFGEFLTHRDIWAILAYIDVLSDQVAQPTKGSGTAPKADLFPAPPLVLGPRTVAEIEAAVTKVASDFQACGDQDGGQIVARLKIRPDGAVEEVSAASSSAPHLATLYCVLERLERVSFPVHTGGEATLVFYAFRL